MISAGLRFSFGVIGSVFSYEVAYAQVSHANSSNAQLSFFIVPGAPTLSNR